MTELLQQISEIDFEYIKEMKREAKVLSSLRTIRKTFRNRGIVNPDLDIILAMKMDNLQQTIEEAKDVISRK